jgi:hypothetical protein
MSTLLVEAHDLIAQDGWRYYEELPIADPVAREKPWIALLQNDRTVSIELNRDAPRIFL